MATPIIGNPLGYFHYSVEQALTVMADLGYDQIEICHAQIQDYKTADLRRQLAQYIETLGMRLVGSNVADAAYFQALGSDQDVKIAAAGLKHDLDLADDLGAQYLSTFEGRVPAGASSQDIFGQVLDKTVNLFKQVTKYAADKGIDVLVEVHPFTLGINVDFATQLCDRVNMDSFGITYDSCHFAVGLPTGYIKPIDLFAHRIKCVHFSDSDKISSELHFAPETGCLDLDGIWQALKRIHYQGPWMLDLYLYPMPEYGSQIGLNYMRKGLTTFEKEGHFQ